MIGHSGKLLLILYLLASPAVPAGAGCDTCQWRDRGDRWEGIVEREQISGASFQLLGVHRRPLPEAAVEGELLYLSFWPPAPPAPAAIEVWQPARLYRMRPAPQAPGAGRQEFAWPRGEVIDRLGLSVASLYARIRSGEVYHPALLSTRAGQSPEEGYTFFFLAGAGIDAECTIVRRGEEARVLQRFECFEDLGGTMAIEWDGRDGRGQPVPPGVYVLDIEGEMLAETFRPLRRRVSFWHPGQP